MKTERKKGDNIITSWDFRPHAIIANDSEKFFVIVGKKNGKPVYWSDQGFSSVKLQAAILDEEAADKIARRIKDKNISDVKLEEYRSDNDNTKLEASNQKNQYSYKLKMLQTRLSDTKNQALNNPNDVSLKNAILNLKEDIARTREEMKGLSMHAADGESADNSENEESDDDDIEDSSDDDEAAVQSLIDFVKQNNVSRSDVNTVFDKALAAYADDLKNNGPVDDAIGFIVDTLGVDDANTALKSLANVNAMKDAPGTGV